ncbi:HAD-IIIC family phosphatase [Anaerofilum sp. BX8]|uniref:HAD-IIIC family phosphatase n=1 Tax=Anaerofilum hominis TaxID=2763016 RepID=A0A923IAV1_9FIRM|nr:HAD-IIIC family phosphatase [Anaerofilum hominis]MBC5582056.1 HAD-IIIC family phosphatase [Anaerofilum hominis]
MSLLDYPFDGAALLQKKRSLRRELLQRPGLVEKKIAILSGSTIGEIKNILELFLLDHGIKPEFYVGGYGLFYENLVFDDGSLAAFKPDFLYIHTSRKNIKDLPVPSDSAEAAAAKLDAEWARFEAAFTAAGRFGCPVIVNSFDAPTHRLMGSRDAVDPRGGVHFINELNARIATFVSKNDGFYLNDLAYLAARFGLDNWFSESEWYLYKYAVSMQYIPELCHSIANIIKSLLGKNKKGLVLDLDNTLWGGVIGEVGPEGVELSTETPGGMAYSEFQQYLKELESLGILLNVASKNEQAAAESGFAREDSPLKREDFLCFKANWEPKSENIAKIAQEINILPESLVFVDDNPAEREIVRQQLPGVAVAAFDGPEGMIASLDRAGYFEVTTLSADDAKRNEMYRQNLARAAVQQNFGSYDDYLRSLEMTAELGAFDQPHAERITQLINKTNQFNLTTRRYTAQEVEALIGSPAAVTLYGRLTDKFGDNGLVSAMIGSVEDGVCTVDLWIMSCRVFKRNLEQAMMDEFVRRCAACGIRKIVGRYLPTAKNLLVKEIYATMGFEKVSESDAETVFSLDVAAYQQQNHILAVTAKE